MSEKYPNLNILNTFELMNLWLEAKSAGDEDFAGEIRIEMKKHDLATRSKNES
jgi:hypothetical protein